MVIMYDLQKVKNNNSLSLTGPVSPRVASQLNDTRKFLLLGTDLLRDRWGLQRAN